MSADLPKAVRTYAARIEPFALAPLQGITATVDSAEVNCPISQTMRQ